MYSISFVYDENLVNFEKRTKKDLYTDIIDWLYNNGYKFDGPLHKPFSRKVLSLDDIKNLIKSRTSYRLDHFHNISSSGNYILCNKFGTAQGFDDIFKMLDNFGISKSSIKTKGLESEIKIKKFGEVDSELDEPVEVENNELVEKIKVVKKNPFRQSVCVLGDPGAGKSTTVRKILRSEGYKFQIWEPSAATTGLLAQFTPLKGYIPSRVGSMMIAASKDPENLYTFVIEEAHKSSIIEMINDELKHAISLRRFEGDRFVPYEDSTSYLAEYLEEDDGGNLKVPDNFGFIFISSKPKVIANNGDIFDRLDIILLKHYEEEKIQSVSELLSKVLSPEEKIKLKATRND